MTIAATGAIDFNDISAELGNAANSKLSLGSSAVRGLAGVTTGKIKLSDLYGKALVVPVDIIQTVKPASATIDNPGFYTGTLHGYWIGKPPLGTITGATVGELIQTPGKELGITQIYILKFTGGVASNQLTINQSATEKPLTDDFTSIDIAGQSFALSSASISLDGKGSRVYSWGVSTTAATIFDTTSSVFVKIKV